MSIEPAPARHHTGPKSGTPTFERRHPSAHPTTRTGWRRPFVREWILMVLLGAAGLVAFAKLGAVVFSHESTSFDGTVQGWMLAHHTAPLETTFRWITTIGGIMGMRILALAGAVYLWFHGHRRVASGVLVVPVVAHILFDVAKRIWARPRPLGLGGHVDDSFSFPSGHATVSAAVCCTLAYVLWRERLLSGRVALTLAVLVPVLVGVSRLYLNVHWATDVLGGWSVGLCVAALSAMLYNHHRRRRASAA